jgi:hypothetical protein
VKVNITGFDLDKPNRNNRIYTRECLEKVINESKSKIDEGLLFVTDRIQYSPEVNVSDIIGNVKSLEIEGDKVVADIHGYKIPILGKIHIETFINDGIYLEITPNGIGSLNEKNEIIDYKLISFSISIPPSRSVE